MSMLIYIVFAKDYHELYNPVDRGCRIHQLPLCRGVRPLPPMSVLKMTQDYLMVRLLFRGMCSTL